MIRRREFIAGLGGVATPWPLVASAQPVERVRHLAVLTGFGQSDPEAKTYLSVFMQALAESGWIEGRNLRTDVRWTDGNADRIRLLAKELIDLQPDAILSQSTGVTGALARETRTIPIVFVLVSDPVGDRFVAGLPRPGGNITGFGDAEAAMAGKWLELLTEIAPGVKRAAMLFNPDWAPGGGSYYLPSFEAAARSLKVMPTALPVRGDDDIDAAVSSVAQEPGGGLVVTPDAFMLGHRARIVAAAARNNLPAVYPQSVMAQTGGLLSYGADYVDLFRRAAPYVDRILRGAKPADLPVQLPVKYFMVVNARTAKTLGITVPPSILVRADEVIE